MLIESGETVVIQNSLQAHIISDIEEIESIRSVWEAVQNREVYPKVDADIDRYLSIINTDVEKIQPYILLINQNDKTVSMLIGYIHKNVIKCKIGRRVILKPSLKILNVIYGGIIGDDSEEIRDEIFHTINKTLQCGQADVACFNHLENESELYKFFRNKPNILCRSYFPKMEAHWCMSVPVNIDKYFEECSKKRRQNLKRYIRNLEKDFPDQIKMVTYSEEDQVEEAIKIASRISSQTYQGAYGGGIVDDEKTYARFNVAAKKGWLRMHVLYIENEPCAFAYRLKYKKTYFAQAIGYSPKWKHYKVGHVLFIKILEVICKDPDIQRIDFGFGDGYHKQWDTMNSHQEAMIYIFACRIFPVLVNAMLTVTLAISNFVQYVVTRLGIYDAVQRYRRKTALEKKSDYKQCA